MRHSVRHFTMTFPAAQSTASLISFLSSAGIFSPSFSAYRDFRAFARGRYFSRDDFAAVALSDFHVRRRDAAGD